MLSVDLSNAFNLVNRKAFLKGVQEHFPALLAWTAYCYGDDAPYLWSGEDVIRSVTGVQQGDPLGPLLFAVALHPMAVELKERLQDTDDCREHEPLLSMWYLDDGYIIATHQKLQKALDYLLSDEVKRSGLHLNLSKCEIWWDLELSDNIKEAYPSEVSQRYNDGTFVLNAPIGSHRFMEDSIVQKVKALDPLFQEVSALESTHVSFTLLKFCMGVCKVNYLLRVTPVQCTKSGAQVFDDLVEKSLRHIVGGVLDTEIFRELQLPAEVKLNCQNPTLGLGLTSATTTAASAFLSSAASCNCHMCSWMPLHMQ